MEPRKSPVHLLAESLGLPVFTPRGLRGAEETAAFKALNADVAVVAAYGLILPRAILEAPRLGCLNLHGSILPRWRGAAPIQRAIMAGDSESGVDVMRMEEGLDTGPVALETRVPIGPDMTAGELHDALALAGAPLMAERAGGAGARRTGFHAAERGGRHLRAKDRQGRGAHRLAPPRAANCTILSRGLAPFPGAFFEADLGAGVERVKVLRTRVEEGAGEPGTALDDEGLIACGEGALRLLRVQRAGKGPMDFAEFSRGRRIERGARLGG